MKEFWESVASIFDVKPRKKIDPPKDWREVMEKDWKAIKEDWEKVIGKWDEEK